MLLFRKGLLTSDEPRTIILYRNNLQIFVQRKARCIVTQYTRTLVKISYDYYINERTIISSVIKIKLADIRNKLISFVIIQD
jgi:hypothetical protein